MQRFKDILFVASSGSGTEPALLRAFELAKRNQGRLTVVQLATSRPDALSGDLGIQIDGLMQKAEEQQLNELEQLADALENLGARPATRLLRGKPFLSIIQEVLRNNHDLVMKTAEGPAGEFRSRLFGSTDQHLMRKCPFPVWLFKEGQGEGFRSVLAAIDVGQSENADLNRKILQLSSTLASKENAAFHVVHAWAPFGEAIMMGQGRKETREVLAELYEAEEIRRKGRLEALVRTELGPEAPAELHLVRAEAAEGVGKIADAVEADVVVMGTLSRAGIRGLLIGNTAETVLGRLDCSVLTVKPDDFQTPISL